MKIILFFQYLLIFLRLKRKYMHKIGFAFLLLFSSKSTLIRPENTLTLTDTEIHVQKQQGNQVNVIPIVNKHMTAQQKQVLINKGNNSQLKIHAQNLPVLTVESSSPNLKEMPLGKKLEQQRKSILLAVKQVAPSNNLALKYLKQGFKGSFDDNIIKGESNKVEGAGNNIGGQSNILKGQGNIIIGNSNAGVGDTNYFEGHSNLIAGDTNSAVGKHNKIIGIENAANGEYNTIMGQANVAKGNQNVVAGQQNVIGTGNMNQIQGQQNAVSIGDQNFLSGIMNIIQGNLNYVEGSENMIEQDQNRVIGDKNLIMGSKNNIIGSASKVLGNQNKVKGNQNIVNGNRNSVSGNQNQITQITENDISSIKSMIDSMAGSSGFKYVKNLSTLGSH